MEPEEDTTDMWFDISESKKQVRGGAHNAAQNSAKTTRVQLKYSFSLNEMLHSHHQPNEMIKRLSFKIRLDFISLHLHIFAFYQFLFL